MRQKRKTKQQQTNFKQPSKDAQLNKQNHKRDFEQLLDDSVIGIQKPKKK